MRDVSVRRQHLYFVLMGGGSSLWSGWGYPMWDAVVLSLRS